MSIPFISFEAADPLLNWLELTDALAAGHDLPKAEIGDTFLYRGSDTLLSRAAWIDGLGVAVKSATVLPGNPSQGRAMINGAVNVFCDESGEIEAILDFHLVTKWKTAGDSLLAARRLARPDSKKILLVGAGTVARNLHSAYSAAFPAAEFTVWNRTRAKAKAMGLPVADDLADAVAGADIVACATMSTEPVIRGEWLSPGTHVDLIGAYRPDMREADDLALKRSSLYVDSYETTIGHIGEIEIPLKSGAISRQDLRADYYDLSAFNRQSDSEITLFKNGGGAHLDLMSARYILAKWRAQTS
jgi:ornithine cyclodeaminase/alanine dehydrogenase-like protein (mu-crystallin family)